MLLMCLCCTMNWLSGLVCPKIVQYRSSKLFVLFNLVLHKAFLIKGHQSTKLSHSLLRSQEMDVVEQNWKNWKPKNELNWMHFLKLVTGKWRDTLTPLDISVNYFLKWKLNKTQQKPAFFGQFVKIRIRIGKKSLGHDWLLSKDVIKTF